MMRASCWHCVALLEVNGSFLAKILTPSELERKQMTYLGITNGWKKTPAKYIKHLTECGTEHETTICYMEYPEKGAAIKRQRQEMRKRYDLTVKKSGTYSVKTEETCNDCGCSWESWT